MKYTSEDLTTLSSGRAYREKIGMYLSANRQEAINLGLRELIVNAQDEYEVYKPKGAFVKIILDTKEKTISVEDNLRGIPAGYRADGINSLVAAFLYPHSGAKHEEGAYSSSIGINGQGAKIVCHTSEWLRVLVRRDKKSYSVTFKSDKEGAKVDQELTEKPLTKDIDKTGTYIKYKPDQKVYGDIFIDIEELKTMLKEMSYFTKGLAIILTIDGVEENFYSENGLVDGLNNESAISKPFSYFYSTDECQVELALQWVNNKGNIKGYANGLYMPDGGAFMTGFRSSLTRTFNSLAKTKSEGEVIRNLLDGYVSVKVRVGQFTNQQKTALANPEAREATSRAISDCLNQFYKEHNNEFSRVLELLMKVEKAEAAATRARDAILNVNKEVSATFNKKNFKSDKLKNAERLGESATLLLAEGDSAMDPLVAGRLAAKATKDYGILALRGKMINCLAHDEEKIYENNEVKLILSALGVTPNNYNPKKLKYGKVAISTDADR